MNTLVNGALAIVLTLITGQCVAALKPGEGVVRDPVTGNYTATFWDEDGGEIVTADFKTATKVDPTVRSTFKTDDVGNIRYAYRISNGNTAKQPITKIRLFGLPVNATLLNSDPVIGSNNSVLIEFFNSSLTVPSSKWVGSGARNEKELNISWLCDSWDYAVKNHDTAVGIQPGASLSGFGYSSPDLPGIFLAKLFGNTRYHQFNFSGAGPEPYSDIDRRMSEIETNDFVPRAVAAPLIAVPNPFDAASILDRIRAHVATWQSRQLVNAVFAAQLDRYLAAAADAYRLNNAKAGKEHIETLRKMLAKEHHNLDHDDEDEDDFEEHKVTTRFTIDRLAARVLDFDLRYVLRRTGKDKERD